MCEWYDSKGETCISCFDGFELNANLDCRMLDSRKNCLIGAGDFCWICKYGFERIFTGNSLNQSSCIKKDSSKSKHCDFYPGKSKIFL